MPTIWTFHPAADIVVTGTDPDRADVTNPRGNLYGFTGYVVAEDRNGNRRRLDLHTAHLESDALAPCAKLAAALNARMAAGKLPVCFDDWAPTRPAYGSDAWIAYGEADELALELREAEEDAWGFQR